MSMVLIGVDLGKTKCSLVGRDGDGRRVFQRTVMRDKLEGMLAQQSACVVALEASCGAHHLGRRLQDQGHEVRLLAPDAVRPYVGKQKNDLRDAEAIAEAATRPHVRPVALKSEEQLDIQFLHRDRERLVSNRGDLIRQLRSMLLERGIRVAQSKDKLVQALPDIRAGARGELSAAALRRLDEFLEEWAELDRRIDRLEAEIRDYAKSDRLCVLLMTIPGIGPITATAMVARMGGAEQYASARAFAAALGLVPRQHTTGGRVALGRITKCGDAHLRKLLVHGARSALRHLAKRETALGQWLRGVLQRRHKNIAVVALAAKLARIAWAVMVKREPFRPAPKAAAGTAQAA
jgi:transposase